MHGLDSGAQGMIELQATMEWRLDADLSQYWNWNTKIIFAYIQAEYVTKLNSVNQASLFDVIMMKKSRTRFKGRVKQKYEFMDQGKHMRGMPFNMTLTWCIMPRVGALRCYTCFAYMVASAFAACNLVCSRGQQYLLCFSSRVLFTRNCATWLNGNFSVHLCGGAPQTTWATCMQEC